MANSVESLFYLLLILLANEIEDISDLMSPAALNREVIINEGQSGEQPFPSVSYDEFELRSPEAASV